MWSRSAFACVMTLAAVAHAGELPRAMGLHPRTGPALALVDSKIEVTVRGPIAEAVVTQKFLNKTDHATEATYVFPLPADAAVSAMSIKHGARTIRAAIAKREDAQRRYEDAVRAGVSASLLDQERPDVFTQTVAAIPARASVEVTIRFDTLARYQDGTWEMVLPLVVAPRYVPGRATNQPTTGTGRSPDTDRAPDASRVTPGGAPGAGGATEVVIRFADKPVAVTSPTHDLKLAGSEARFVDPKTDHDAIVRWRSTAAAAGWVEQAPDGGYAAIVVEAPAAQRKGSVKTLLVLDRSAASRGDADAVARPLVRTLLGALTSGDRIAVHGSDAIAWGAPADVARTLEGAWSTPAGAFDLTRVLGSARPQGAPVILVSGGLVADDRAAIAAAQKLGVPIHIIGVGPAPARGLLAQVAAASGGTLRFATPGDDLRALVKATLADLTTPPAPLTVTWGTLAASEVVPGSLPRLGAGQATIVLARVKRAQTANARTRGELFAIELLPAQRAVDGQTSTLGPLARRWARNRLDELVHARAAPAVVTAHALKYGLVSPYTSMVAIGDEVVVQGGVKRSIAIPVSVPAGMKWQEVKQQTAVEIDATGTAKVDKKPETRKLDETYTKNVPVPTNRPPPKKEPLPASSDTAQRPGVVQPSPPPPPDGATLDRDTAGDVSTLRKRRSNAGDAEDDNAPADEGELAREAPAPARIALAGRMSSAESIAITSELTGRRYRFSLGAGGGFLRTEGQTVSLLQLDARVERGISRRWLAGLDASLWIVDGNDVAGHALVSAARYGIARWFETGLATGVQFGNGFGPAGSLSLRFHLPMQPRASLYLRYDGALIYNDGKRRGQSTATFGIEYGF